MKLQSSDIDEIRYLVGSGDAAGLQSEPLEDITLAAIFELTCCWWEWRQNEVKQGIQLVEKWAHDHRVLREAWDMLNWHQWPQTELFSAPTFEICPAPSSDELTQPSWTEFAQRFTNSLQRNGGFDLRLARALTGAMWEMANNVSDHSGPDRHHPAPGLVAYQVGRGRMQYVVADVGRGVLNSLRSNPSHQHLQDSRAALLAAIRDHATCRSSEPLGGGFRQVEQSLADLNGHLRYRSGNGVLTLDGRGSSRQINAGISSPPLIGLQLSIDCSLN